MGRGGVRASAAQGGAHGHGAAACRHWARVQCAQAAQQGHSGGRYYRSAHRASTLRGCRSRRRARRRNRPLWATRTASRAVEWARSRAVRPTDDVRHSRAIVSKRYHQIPRSNEYMMTPRRACRDRRAGMAAVLLLLSPLAALGSRPAVILLGVSRDRELYKVIAPARPAPTTRIASTGPHPPLPTRGWPEARSVVLTRRLRRSLISRTMASARCPTTAASTAGLHILTQNGLDRAGSMGRPQRPTLRRSFTRRCGASSRTCHATPPSSRC